ncbi:unnamed protein product [Effrenium voratum]|uniref:Transmembrane protein n=1 Tax=Effrenium voratum TaxID=2562239 RepID=A0AA36HWE5_9DINO|nr:unnamed protein product [Effrenium voratum]
MARHCRVACLAFVAYALRCICFARPKPMLDLRRVHAAAGSKDLDGRVGAGLASGMVKGVLIGSGQYLWVIWQHLTDCPRTLEADSTARQLFSSTDSWSGWFLSTASSAWTWMFADVSAKQSAVQFALKQTVIILCLMFVAQLIWNLFSQRRGRISDTSVGLRAWKSVMTLLCGALASRCFCQLTMSQCVKSSWTGLPYYSEGHLLCAGASILSGVFACSALSATFARWHRRKVGAGGAGGDSA